MLTNEREAPSPPRRVSSGASAIACVPSALGARVSRGSAVARVDVSAQVSARASGHGRRHRRRSAGVGAAPAFGASSERTNVDACDGGSVDTGVGARASGRRRRRRAGVWSIVGANVGAYDGGSVGAGIDTGVGARASKHGRRGTGVGTGTETAAARASTRPRRLSERSDF